MTTPTDIAPGRNRKDLAARIGWFALIVATLYVCYFSHLGAIGFVGPDEPRYAWIARDMAKTGDWVTPRLYGMPWFEKPPLYYWGAAICFKLFGVSEAAARLPSAICALLATLAMAWLARRIYGAETARWLLLLLPTTVGMIGFSHAAATDMPFSAMLTIAMVCAAALLRLPLERDGLPPLSRNETIATNLPEPPPAPSAIGTQGVTPPFAKTSWPAAILFGFFLGLAVLAKGPAGIILCGGSIFFWAVFTKRWRDAFRILHPAAITAFCATALPWYILCARRNPDFFRIFIIEHNFKRFLTPEFQHIQPFWFYIPVLAAALIPWPFLLIPVSANAKNALRNRQGAGAGLFLVSAALFPVLFFSVSRSKLPGYVLPSVPFIALLCSAAAKEMLFLKSRFTQTMVAVSAVTAIVLVVLTGRASLHFREIAPFPVTIYDPPIALQLARLLGIALGLGALLLVMARRSQAGLVCTAAALVAILASAPLANFDFALSPRAASEVITKMNVEKAEVLGCEVPRSSIYGFDFYLRNEIREWSQVRPSGKTIVIAGKGTCLDQIRKANYVLRAESDFPKWTIVAVEASAAHPPGGGQPQ